MSKASEKAAEQAAALSALRKTLTAGTTVYTVIRHISQSGMSRVISAHYVVNGELRWVDLSLAGFALHRRECGYVVKEGFGMDMAWHAVYSLSIALHGDGYALLQRSL